MIGSFIMEHQSDPLRSRQPETANPSDRETHSSPSVFLPPSRFTNQIRIGGFGVEEGSRRRSLWSVNRGYVFSLRPQTPLTPSPPEPHFRLSALG